MYLFGTRSLISSSTISARSTAYSLSLTHSSQPIYFHQLRAKERLSVIEVQYVQMV